jgi:16S rRNA (cytidine1402-2'-O)-methyltransferase
MIFYEAPHRIKRCLYDMAKAFGKDRNAAVVKEITKVYEKVARGSLEELASTFEREEAKGEFVVVVEGGEAPEPEKPEKSIEEAYEDLMAEGVGRKEAMRIIARQYNISRRDVYSHVNKDN